MSDTTPTGDASVLVERHEAVTLVTLNRPSARNALNAELRARLRATMVELDADDTVAAIVLTGADPAFCAGLDLKELAAAGPEALATGFGDDSELRRPIPVDHTTPVIGAINGVAITGGFELALGCDLLVASEHARFADTHARMGIMPGWGLTVLLPQAIGVRRARELSFTGNFLDADTALAWGLVNHVVPHAELLPTALGLAADIAGSDRAGVVRMLTTYRDGALLTGAEALRLETTVSKQWIEERGNADLEARRQAVTERGRNQTRGD